MINKTAHKLTKFVIEKGNKEENYDIYQYGFTVGIELMISIIVGALIAVLFKRVQEFVVYLAFLIPLRAFAGGMHLGSFSKCFYLSTGVTTLVIIVANNWQLKIIYNNLCIVFLICLIKFFARNHSEQDTTHKYYSKKLNYTLIYIGIATILFNIADRRKWLTIVLLVLVIEFSSIILEKCFFSKQRQSK